jgi:polysaccharide biosynthesis/export protein
VRNLCLIFTFTPFPLTMAMPHHAVSDRWLADRTRLFDCTVTGLIAIATGTIATGTIAGSTISPALAIGLPELTPMPTPLPPAALTRPSDAASYYIGPGDELRITVIGYPEYTGAQNVLSDGTIALPLIGNITAADRTPAQLTQDLTTQLNKILVNPAVSVIVSTQRPVTVNVAGAVQRPGPVQLKNLRVGGDLTQSPTAAGVVSLQRPTVTAALLEAGGVSREADLRLVTLKRYSPNRSLPPVTINLWDTITADAPARDLTLQDGDTLFIPKLAADDRLDKTLLAKSSFAPRTVRVKVVGEVKKPGEIPVPPDSTLSSAIAIAGGPTDKARMKEVTFVRRLPDGKLVERQLDLDKLTDDIQVEDGDVLYVPLTPGDKALGVANQVVSPLGLILRLFGIK